MSERGSFVTQFIYCPECLASVVKVLGTSNKYLCGAEIPAWNGGDSRIVAGKVGGLYPGEEIDTFTKEYVPQLELFLCHELRIAVLGEQGEKVFHIKPRGKHE